MSHFHHKGCGCVNSILGYLPYQKQKANIHSTPPEQDPISSLEQPRYYVANKIYTLDQDKPHAQAVMVHGETIQKVYNEKEWDSFKQTEDYKSAQNNQHISHLKGYLYPGFYECHMHPLLDGLLQMGGVDLRNSENVDSLQQALNDRLQAESADAEKHLVLGYNVDPLSQPVPTTQTWLSVLDQIGQQVGSQPANIYVLVEHNSMHIWYVNTHLLNAIFENNPGLETSSSVETYFPKKDGKFTGVVQENEGIGYLINTLVKTGLTPTDPKVLEQATLNIAKQAHSVGCTTITDAMTGAVEGDLATYYKVTTERSLEEMPVRLVVHPYFESEFALNTIALTDKFTNEPQVNRRLRIGAVKYVVDGSLQGGTAYQPPYLAEGFDIYFNGSIDGVLNLTEEQLAWRLRTYKNQRRQPMIHANSTSAIQIALDALKTVYPSPEQMREAGPRIEHCQIATSKQLEFMAEWGIKANILINHVYYWGEIYYNQLLPPAVAEAISPVKTALDLGLEVGLHSDAYVSPLSPLRLIWTAVTRHSKKLGNETGNCQLEPGSLPSESTTYDTNKCGVVSPSERVSREQALKGVTVYAAHLDNDFSKGQIKTGMMADFTLLAEDLFKVDEERILDIKVSGTIVGGHYLPLINQDPN